MNGYDEWRLVSGRQKYEAKIGMLCFSTQIPWDLVSYEEGTGKEEGKDHNSTNLDDGLYCNLTLGAGI